MEQTMEPCVERGLQPLPMMLGVVLPIVLEVLCFGKWIHRISYLLQEPTIQMLLQAYPLIYLLEENGHPFVFPDRTIE